MDGLKVFANTLIFYALHNILEPYAYRMSFERGSTEDQCDSC